MKKIFTIALFIGAFALIASPGYADKVPIPKAKTETLVIAKIGHVSYQEVAPSIDMAPVTTLATFDLPQVPLSQKSFAEHRERRWREVKIPEPYNYFYFKERHESANFVTSLNTCGAPPLRC